MSTGNSCPHNHFWEQNDSGTHIWGFSVPQICQFCLLTNWRNGNELYLKTIPLLLPSILSSISFAKTYLCFFNAVWRGCYIWILYGNKVSLLRIILCAVDLLNWHAAAVFQTDFLGKCAIVTSTNCTFASVIVSSNSSDFEIGIAVALSSEHSTLNRKTKVQVSSVKTLPCTLVAPGACKIRHGRNVPKFPFKLYLWGSHPLRGRSKLW